MTDPMTARLSELQTLNLTELQQRWKHLYGKPAPNLAPDMLVRALAYRMQEQAYGGLKAKTARKLRRIANALQNREPTPQTSPSGPGPGARLLREWNGQPQIVDVLTNGFAWRGKIYPSLSAVARAITGSRWSGPRFFGLPTHDSKLAAGGQE